MPARAPPLYLDHALGSARALSRRGLVWLLAALAVWNLLIAAFLLLIGAWPAPAFLGLDFIGVVIAFAVSNRRAGLVERIQVSADTVCITRGNGAEARVVWKSPTTFTKVALEGARGERLRLWTSGRSFSLGATLATPDRLALGRALTLAVERARAERWR